LLIDFGSPLSEVGFGAQGTTSRRLAFGAIVLIEQFRPSALVINVLVIVAGVEQTRILSANRQRQSLLDGVKENVITKDMALD